MSHENAEIVRRATDAFNDVGMAEAARRVRLFEQFDELWEEHRSEAEEIRVVDDERVLLLSIEHFKGRDGLEIAQPSGSVYTFRDGKIVRLQAFWERENALKAAGLAE